MVAVKFNIDVVDSVTQNRYIASTEFVEVSEEFAERLRNAGTDVEFEDDDFAPARGGSNDAELILQLQNDHADELSDLKQAHSEEIEALKAEIESLKSTQVQPELSEKDKVREEYVALIGVKAGNKSVDTMRSEIAAYKQQND